MDTEKDFTVILDRYLECKRQCDVLTDETSGEENTSLNIAKAEYIDARKALNDYMLFMRRLAHSHPDDIETDI